MCHSCREAVLALRFSRSAPNLCIPPASARWAKTALGVGLCLHCQDEPPWLTFSCSVLWSRVSEKEPEVPVSCTLNEACEEESSQSVLLAFIEGFVSDRGFSGLQGLIRMIFSCSHVENVDLSNPTDK